MLGMVFTELLEMVEERYSPELADRLVAAAEAPHGGAYTAVGDYPFGEMQRMLAALATATGLSIADLLGVFGEHLFGRLACTHPELINAKAGLFDLLAELDAQIHPEVLKLYPRAELPRFRVLDRSAQGMLLRYDSPRRMEAFALGLIRGAAVHYGEACTVSAEPAGQPDDSHVRILVTRRHAD